MFKIPGFFLISQFPDFSRFFNKICQILVFFRTVGFGNPALYKVNLTENCFESNITKKTEFFFKSINAHKNNVHGKLAELSIKSSDSSPGVISLILWDKCSPNKYLNKCYKIRILFKFGLCSLNFSKISVKLWQ